MRNPPYSYYLGELFNPDSRLVGRRFFSHHFTYLPDHLSHAELEAHLERILEYTFEWPERRRWLPSSLSLYRRTRQFIGYPIPIVKDPVAVFSAPWLARRFNMRVIVLVRHPAAFVDSMSRARWPVNFRSLLAQQRLMDEWLTDYEEVFRNPPSTFVERAAWLWRAIYEVVRAYCRLHSNWPYWRLEDIAINPINSFAEIFRFAQIPYNSSVKSRILKSSSSRNPVVGPANELHLITRNSKASQQYWHSQLTGEEVHRIRRIVEPVSHSFYVEEDWITQKPNWKSN